MKPAVWLILAVLAGLAVLVPVLTREKKGAVVLINVSYDPTRELYKEISGRFARASQGMAGSSVTVNSSHGGSASQARAVLGGLKADVATLALASDLEALEDRGFIQPGWAARHPGNSCPYTSTIVFLVRKGNPKAIRGWQDLIRSDVSVITPNPKTSGGARWNFLAAWGSVTQSGGDEKQAEEFIKKFYERVPVLDTGARGATTTFVQKKLGDVLIGWESEAILALKEEGGDRIEIVRPESTILAEPPVAIVDKVVDQKGTRAAAESFVTYLYSDEAQEVIAGLGYRPFNASILEKHRNTLPPFRKLFTIRDLAGSWREAQKRFFADGGVFDRLTSAR